MQQLAQQANVNQLSSPMPPLQVSVFTARRAAPCCGNNLDLASRRHVARLDQPGANSEHAML
jgi:hypothetical protein